LLVTRTLVTGAAGFTGRYLTRLLAANGHEVHGLVHNQSNDSPTDTTFMHFADLTDYHATFRVVDDVRPHHVVHLAGIAFVAHGDIAEMYCANVIGARQLLHTLAALPEPPRSVVMASSANVYGNARAGILDESMLPSPVNDYGVSKVASEYVAKLYRDRLPIIVTRPFNYTGRGQSTSFVIPKIIEHARRRQTTIELGSLDVERDFSDVRFVADVYARLLVAPAAIGKTFNLCSGSAVSLSEVLERVTRLSGHQFDVRVNPELVRTNEVRTLLGSSANLAAAIGPLEPIPLDETLAWMLEPE
jgi:GDP-6-deoxy-D-talose 4-dehydrogenase